MSVTSGFFNSIDYDRPYDARDMSKIFDGIIRDGVYEMVGNHLNVAATTGLSVTVDTGRAWFEHTWVLNDALLPLTLDPADILLPRIDAIVIEVDLDGRIDRIKTVTGVPAETPARPTLASGPRVFQYPLAYIEVEENTETITQSDITNMIGTSECPFVTAPLESISIDTLIAQWEAEYNEWVRSKENDVNSYETSFLAWTEEKRTQMDNYETEFYAWMLGKRNAFSQYLDDQEEEIDSWAMGFENGITLEVEDWYHNLQVQIDEDVAVHLQNEIDRVAEKAFRYFYGIKNNDITITDDGYVVTQVNDEFTSVATMEHDYSRITTVLTPVEGHLVYTKTDVFTIVDHEITAVTTRYSYREKDE